MKTLLSKQKKITFDDFFREYYPRLLAYACMFVEKQAAEDLVQDIFLHIWENRSNISIHTSLESYLFKSVYNRCLNYLKHRKCLLLFKTKIEQEVIRQELYHFNPDNIETLNRIFVNDIRKEIDTAIGALPIKCREVFKLSYLEDKKNREIAEMLGLSDRTVENHVSNALKRLRVVLAKAALFLS